MIETIRFSGRQAGRMLGICLLALTAACTTVKQSDPSRTATEELLISTAADRAASQLVMQIPKNAKTFLDTTNFEGTDSKYAIATIRASMTQTGIQFADDKKSADVIVEIRAGALSTDNKETLVGIPSFSVPVPFASTALTTPEIALYKSDDQKGVAKFASNAYNGKGAALSFPQQDVEYGFSHNQKHTILIFFTWSDNDAVPSDDDMIMRHLHVDNSAASPEPTKPSTVSTTPAAAP